MRSGVAIALLLAGLLAPIGLYAQVRGAPRAGAADAVFRTVVPDHILDAVLSRPTGESITLTLLSAATQTVSLTWSTPDGERVRQAEARLVAGEPQSIELAPLQTDHEYRYAVRGSAGVLAEGQFRTQRARGAPFAFTVTADSHLDDGTRTDVYEQTLRNIVAEAPDLHFDLGDTFMTDKYAAYRDSAAQYLAQRYWFGLLAATSPLFLTLGNHDGEFGYAPRGAQQGMPEWSAAMRVRYFPNPEPNGFYSGSTARLPAGGALQNHYAFEWGDALFVVLDPFWPSEQRGGGGSSGWDITLGTDQYHWLEATLAASRAPLKFVFIHHLVGGSGNEHRGGAEFVGLYEWGGHSANGRDEFAARRPGWSMPIHALLLKYGVNVVFHGHDHLFAHQEVDGIVYQEVPQPSHPEQRVETLAREYGYTHGDILPSPGHLRVSVDAAGARIEYVRSFLSSEARQGRTNARIDFAYAVRPR